MKAFLSVAVLWSICAFISEYHNHTFSTALVYLSSNMDGKTKGEVIASSSTSGFRTPKYDIKYSYIIDGIYYEGFRIDFNGRSKDHTVLRKYFIGKKVDVYYDVTNPRFAILNVGKLGSEIFFQFGVMIFILLFLVFGEFFLWGEPWVRRKSKTGNRFV